MALNGGRGWLEGMPSRDEHIKTMGWGQCFFQIILSETLIFYHPLNCTLKITAIVHH